MKRSTLVVRTLQKLKNLLPETTIDDDLLLELQRHEVFISQIIVSILLKISSASDLNQGEINAEIKVESGQQVARNTQSDDLITMPNIIHSTAKLSSDHLQPRPAPDLAADLNPDQILSDLGLQAVAATTEPAPSHSNVSIDYSKVQLGQPHAASNRKDSECKAKRRSRVIKKSLFVEDIEDGLYQCNYPNCNLTSPFAHMIRRHAATHLAIKEHKCKLCEFATKRKDQLYRHMTLDHAGEKPFECSFCELRFDTNRECLPHMKTHAIEKPHKCHICAYSCSLRGQLNKHLRKHNENKEYKCHVCGFETNFEASLAGHMATHSDDKPYQCETCGKHFRTNSQLISHKKSHLAHKEHKCDLCDYRSVSKYQIKLHKRSHSAEKPFRCRLCSFVSRWKQSLKKHMMYHQKFKKLRCEKCDYSCNYSSSLQQHLKRHTGEDLFQCSLCDYAGIRKADLTAHVRIHTGDKPFACEYCAYRSTHMANLKRHLKTHNVVPHVTREYMTKSYRAKMAAGVGVMSEQSLPLPVGLE